MTILQKANYEFNEIPIKIATLKPWKENTQHHMEKQKLQDK